MEKFGDTWYFTDGWKKFVEDNFIEWGTFMIFKYYGGAFHFKLFGESACETKGVGGPIQDDEDDTETGDDDVVHLDQDDDTEEYQGDEDETETETEDDDVVHLDQDDDDVVHLDEDDDLEEQARDRDEDETETRDDDFGQQENQDDVDREDEVVDGATRGRKRRRISDWFDAELFRSGRVDQPNHPYFVTRITEKRTDELHVPKTVVNVHNLELPEYTVFIDERGNEYASKLHFWTDKRKRYIGGWRELCEDNKVHVDDKLICEFIRGRDGELYIFVRIIRY